MNPIPQTIQEPIRIFPDEPAQDPKTLPEPSIPYGWEDTKDWSFR